MFSIAFIFGFLCLFQSMLLATEERDRTFSDFSEASGITDVETSLSSIDLEEKELDTSLHLKKRSQKQNLPEIFLSDLKYKRWEYARRQLFQGLMVHTEYPPYELLLKTPRPEYYEPSVDSAYAHGWVLDTSEETWEQEQLKERRNASPAFAFMIAGIEEAIDLDTKTKENLDKRKFQGWQERRDLENIQIIMVINYILHQKAFSPDQTNGFIQNAIDMEHLPKEREGMLKLWSDTRVLDSVMEKMWMFVLEDEENHSNYIKQLLIQEIQNRASEQDIDFQIYATLNELKQDQQLPSIVFMRQQRRTERLNGIILGKKTLVIHEPDNKEAICSFLWDSTDAHELSSLLRKKSIPVQRKKEKNTTLRVHFDDLTARLDYHKKDPNDVMDFKGFFLLSPKERISVPRTRTRAMASVDISTAWRSETPCIQMTRSSLKRSPSISFSALVTCPESFEAYGSDSDV